MPAEPSAPRAESPCRLAVYPAHDAPRAVVLRRGPSAWCRLSLWHTDTDTFEHGQWLHARVYERRCDLAWDGELFVAFAARGAPHPNARADSWIAVSRPPWFTALALWWVGGTYCAGGFFTGPRALWTGFRDGPDQGALPAWLDGSPDLPVRDTTNDWTERTVFMNRLLRDGWTRVEGSRQETWERPHPSLHWTLAMSLAERDFTAYGGRHGAEFAVRLGPDVDPVPLGQATWADWDRRGRLALARDGRLLTWDPAAGFTEIADFNPQRPETGAAPAEAAQWPPAPRLRPSA